VPEDLPLLPEQPSTSDNLRRFGPAAIIAVVALLFILQNTESVRFNFLWFDFRWPLWAMLLVFMAIGALMAWGVDRRRTRRSRTD
jgi:uncharacterized integral membrane protein